MAKLRDALQLHEQGWRLVAAPIAGKAPLSGWKAAQTEPGSKAQIQAEFGDAPRNIFIITGAISRLAVLDCDDRLAETYWRERLGPVFDETTCASSGRGKHYYFRLAEGEERKGRSSPGGESGAWDLRANGGGVIAPPSTHPSGKTYRWAQGRTPKELKDAPPELWDTEETEEKQAPKTQLSELLANPPTEGSRNNWLAKVAGHYAAQIKYKDAYEETVRAVAPPGLESEEIKKLIQSIWRSEETKAGHVAPDEAPSGEGGAWRILEPTEESGWLVSGSTRILVQVRVKDDDDSWKYTLAPWLNADLRVVSVFELDDDSRTYHLEVRTEKNPPREVDVSSKTIGNMTRLNEWLIGLGIGLSAPEGVAPRGMSFSTRLSRYLEAQEAPTATAVDSLGWHDEASGFLTHEGIIRAGGLTPFEAVRPSPRVRKHAPYAYGTEGADGEAAKVLREVLTYHTPDVTAVFGAWWAACLLKPQIARIFSQFPIMAIEAPSEAGKTKGFFSMMLQLAGNIQGNTLTTKAALRDALSAHRNGIVWLDDMDSLDDIGELLRSVTVEGSVVKKGPDQVSQMVVQLRAALVVSGESLGLSEQKALLDRCIDLRVGSPVKRQSLHGAYSQWDDIIRTQREHPNLNDYAGTYVMRALGLLPELEKRAQRLRHNNSNPGRMADKVMVVRLGAKLLEHLAGIDDHWVEEEVERWAAPRLAGYEQTDNSLTTQILPHALMRTGNKPRPEGPDDSHGILPTPVFIAPNTAAVWFSPKLLAAWWTDINHGRVEQRTASESALQQQAKACGAGGKKGAGRKYFEFSTGGGGSVYWRLPEGLGAKVIQRSQGENRDDQNC